MAGPGDREYASCVPVYTDILAMLSDDVGTLLEVRWAKQEDEHEWEMDAVAEHPDADAAADDDDGTDATDRQLALARRLSNLMVWTEHFFASLLRTMGESLREAVGRQAEDRRRRPHPGTAAWWRQRGRGELRYTRFVQVPREEMACALELVADASERAEWLRELAEDLDRECCLESAAAANAAVVHSTPRLLELLRCAQRLADDILVPLHPLKRLLDNLIGADEPRRRGKKRGREGSATPPRARPRLIRRRSISYSVY